MAADFEAGLCRGASYNAPLHPEDAAMISREPTIERLAIARGLLMEPFGLTDATLSQALKKQGDSPTPTI